MKKSKVPVFREKYSPLVRSEQIDDPATVMQFAPPSAAQVTQDASLRKMLRSLQDSSLNVETVVSELEGDLRREPGRNSSKKAQRPRLEPGVHECLNCFKLEQQVQALAQSFAGLSIWAIKWTFKHCQLHAERYRIWQYVLQYLEPVMDIDQALSDAYDLVQKTIMDHPPSTSLQNIAVVEKMRVERKQDRATSAPHGEARSTELQSEKQSRARRAAESPSQGRRKSDQEQVVERTSSRSLKRSSTKKTPAPTSAHKAQVSKRGTATKQDPEHTAGDVEEQLVLKAGTEVSVLGMRIHAPPHVYVESVVPDGWAASQGIVPLAEIAELNGSSTEAMETATFHSVLKKRPLDLVVYPPSDTRKAPAKVSKLPVQKAADIFTRARRSVQNRSSWIAAMMDRNSDVAQGSRHHATTEDNDYAEQVPEVSVVFRASPQARQLNGVYMRAAGARVNNRNVFVRGPKHLLYLADGNWVIKDGPGADLDSDVYAYVKDPAREPFKVQAMWHVAGPGTSFVPDEIGAVMAVRMESVEANARLRDRQFLDRTGQRHHKDWVELDEWAEHWNDEDWDRPEARPDQYIMYQRMFVRYAQDRPYLTFKQLQRLLSALHEEPMPTEDLHHTVDAVHADSDGKINFRVFLKVMKVLGDLDADALELPDEFVQDLLSDLSHPLPLRVWIQRAEGLPAGDSGSASDSYCICSVPGKKALTLQTPVVKSLNPVWNTKQNMMDYLVGDQLEFEVWDQDTAADDSLGKASLTASEIVPNGYDGKVALLDKNEKTCGFLFVNVFLFHQEDLESKPLWITIVSADDLRDADVLGGSDCYAMCEVPGREDWSFRTPTISDTSNPKWNHSFQKDFTLCDSLLFTVWDEDVGGDDCLGKLLLEPSDFLNGFDGMLPLEDAKAQPGKEPVLHVKLQFREDMDVGKNPLRVTIVRAEGLANRDLMGASDPYCECEVIGKTTNFKFVTKTVHNTLAPVWNHSFEHREFCVGDTLSFTLWDKDPHGRDLLGKATLPSSRFVPDGFEGDLEVEGGAKDERGRWKGKIHVSVEWITHNSTPIRVTIIGAKNLRNADAFGKSDPYCKLQLVIPGHETLEWKTRTIKDTLNPIWDEAFILPMFCAGDDLKFSIFDEDFGKKDDILGSATLKDKQFLPNGFEGHVVLENAGKGHKGVAKIEVCVEILSSEEAQHQIEEEIEEDNKHFEEDETAGQEGGLSTEGEEAEDFL